MQEDIFKQAVFPSIDEFYYDLVGGQESDLQVYWQDNTLGSSPKVPVKLRCI